MPAKTLLIPDFYRPGQTREVYIERAQMVVDAAVKARKAYGIKPSKTDQKKVALFVIDGQIGFCTPSTKIHSKANDAHGGSLFVPGAPEDMQRLIEWAYRNLDRITSMNFTLDTHRMFQVFHPSMWIDKDGNHPAPFTIISVADIDSGKWKPIAYPRELREYAKKLEATGKYALVIWPYHTLLGGISHALVPPLMELAMFHAAARHSQTHFETKGGHTCTENYSVMSPEVRELGGQVVGEFNTAFFTMLMNHDEVWVAGQAKSHCVMETLNDMLRTMQATDPSLVKKLVIIEDAMSSVPAPPGCDKPGHPANFPEVAEKRFAEFRVEGVRFATTRDVIG